MGVLGNAHLTEHILEASPYDKLMDHTQIGTRIEISCYYINAVAAGGSELVGEGLGLLSEPPSKVQIQVDQCNRDGSIELPVPADSHRSMIASAQWQGNECA
jgi:hypothetical protein